MMVPLSCLEEEYLSVYGREGEGLQVAPPKNGNRQRELFR